MADEIFGPILPCLVVGSLSEAIDFVRARPKPLAVSCSRSQQQQQQQLWHPRLTHACCAHLCGQLYLFSSSVQAQEAVVARTSAGSTVVNDLIIQFAAHELPFGGVGPRWATRAGHTLRLLTSLAPAAWGATTASILSTRSGALRAHARVRVCVFCRTHTRAPPAIFSSLRAMHSNPRTVVVRSASSWLDPSVRYAPYTDFKAWLLRKLM